MFIIACPIFPLVSKEGSVMFFNPNSDHKEATLLNNGALAIVGGNRCERTIPALRRHRLFNVVVGHNGYCVLCSHMEPL